MFWHAYCTVKPKRPDIYKQRGWGYIIEADTAEEALNEAVRRGKQKAATTRGGYRGAEIGPGEVEPF